MDFTLSVIKSRQRVSTNFNFRHPFRFLLLILLYVCAMLRPTVLLTLLLSLIIISCNESTENDRITIVTTTGIVGDCVAQIVGDQADIVSLMGPGVDPHLYKASQGDIERLSNADVIVYNGLHLEGKMAQMLENYAHTKPCFAVGSYVDHEALKPVGDGSDLHDPHIWFNPQIWLQGMEGVAKALDGVEGIDSVHHRFLQYSSEIMDTRDSLLQLLDAGLPTERRILITSHDAFEYFGDAFHFRVRGLQGISTAAEYGARDVRELVDFIVENKVHALFVETSISEKNLMAVVDGARARGHEVRIGGTLYSDALGEVGSGAGTYKGMLISNVNTILVGLNEQ